MKQFSFGLWPHRRCNTPCDQNNVWWLQLQIPRFDVPATCLAEHLSGTKQQGKPSGLFSFCWELNIVCTIYLTAMYIQRPPGATDRTAVPSWWKNAVQTMCHAAPRHCSKPLRVLPYLQSDLSWWAWCHRWVLGEQQGPSWFPWYAWSGSLASLIISGLHLHLSYWSWFDVAM